jgi:hypothetical protein
MRGRGITYDAGFFHAGGSTREPFDPDVVQREMRIIHDELHCNAVRVTGGDADRLHIAAQHAADAGLEVWFCPFTCDLTTDELLVCIADCAERAERLRRDSPSVDLDLASYGVVKVLEALRAGTYPGMPWEPKAVFTALADYYHG